MVGYVKTFKYDSLKRLYLVVFVYKHYKSPAYCATDQHTFKYQSINYIILPLIWDIDWNTLNTRILRQSKESGSFFIQESKLVLLAVM